MRYTLFIKKHLYCLLMVCTLLATACRKDRQDAQEQFRQRQQSILERTRQQQTPDADVPDTTGASTPVPAPVAPAPAPATTSVRKPATAAGDKVVGVKDGDTVVLLQNGQEVTVRLYGVDTPEKTQDYGQRAKQFTSDLVFNKQVRLIPKNKDRYGRMVGTIILADGRSLNEELIREGFAWHYKAYSKDINLANMEADARRYKRGLWQSPNPTPPWEYRKDKRTNGASAKKAAAATAPVPAGAAQRTVYMCSSNNSKVYHYEKNCATLRNCKQKVLAVTEAAAIRGYARRADKSCQR